MSKYELTFVVNAKIEDDERAAVVDKCKALIQTLMNGVREDWLTKSRK